MKIVDLKHRRRLRQMGVKVTGEADLGNLLYSALDDDTVVDVMAALARGEVPGINFSGYRIDRDAWLTGQQQLRPLPTPVDPGRRRKRKQRKRTSRQR